MNVVGRILVLIAFILWCYAYVWYIIRQCGFADGIKVISILKLLFWIIQWANIITWAHKSRRKEEYRSERCNGRRGRRVSKHKTDSTCCCLLWTWRRDHGPRNMNGCCKLWMALRWQPARKWPPHSYNHKDLNVANNLNKQERNSPLEPPDRNQLTPWYSLVRVWVVSSWFSWTSDPQTVRR